MEQYIDKAAVVAEIERRRKSNAKEKFFGRLVEDNYFLDFLDTIEVKEVDLEKNVRQVIDLYLEAGNYYNSIIRKEREENGGSDLAIKIMDGVVDARELGVQYVLDKLKVYERRVRYGV